MATTTATQTSNRVVSAVSVLVDGQAYKALAYLLLSFPLGMAYFVAVTVGLSLGVGLAVLGIGIPILFSTLLAVRTVVRFERWRLQAFLGVDVSTPEPVSREGGILRRTRLALGDEENWRSVGYLVFTFGHGIAGFTLVVTGLALSAALLSAPLTYDSTAVGLNLGFWEPATLLDGVLLAPLGVVALVLTLHACIRLAGVAPRVAKMLGSSEQ